MPTDDKPLSLAITAVVVLFGGMTLRVWSEHWPSGPEISVAAASTLDVPSGE
jgi:hypothetical protein